VVVKFRSLFTANPAANAALQLNGEQNKSSGVSNSGDIPMEEF